MGRYADEMVDYHTFDKYYPKETGFTRERGGGFLKKEKKAHTPIPPLERVAGLYSKQKTKPKVAELLGLDYEQLIQEFYKEYPEAPTEFGYKNRVWWNTFVRFAKTFKL